MASKTVFIVSQDPAVCDVLAQRIASIGLRAETLPSMRAWRETVGSQSQGCLILDACLEDLVDPDPRASFAATCSRAPVLVLTERGDVPAAVRAMKLGAAEVLQKPVRAEALLEYIKQAVAEKGDGVVTD